MKTLTKFLVTYVVASNLAIFSLLFFAAGAPVLAAVCTATFVLASRSNIRLYREIGAKLDKDPEA